MDIAAAGRADLLCSEAEAAWEEEEGDDAPPPASMRAEAEAGALLPPLSFTLDAADWNTGVDMLCLPRLSPAYPLPSCLTLSLQAI